MASAKTEKFLGGTLCRAVPPVGVRHWSRGKGIAWWLCSSKWGASSRQDMYLRFMPTLSTYLASPNITIGAARLPVSRHRTEAYATWVQPRDNTRASDGTTAGRGQTVRKSGPVAQEAGGGGGGGGGGAEATEIVSIRSLKSQPAPA